MNPAMMRSIIEAITEVITLSNRISCLSPVMMVRLPLKHGLRFELTDTGYETKFQPKTGVPGKKQWIPKDRRA
jgi:hypothetical protein